MSVRDLCRKKLVPEAVRANLQSFTPEVRSDYSKEPGISRAHARLWLGSVDEKHPEFRLQLGHDPVQYTSPDGSFAKRSARPLCPSAGSRLPMLMSSWMWSCNHVYDANSYAFESDIFSDSMTWATDHAACG